MLDIPQLSSLLSSTHSTEIPTSFATVSLNNLPTTSTPIPLPTKLSAISRAGYDQIELGFPDLVSFASALLNREVSSTDYDALCSAGEEVKRLCEKEGLKVLMLQPFSNFEGWDESNEDGKKGREDAWSRARGWVRVMGAVRTDMLQVGATDTPTPLVSSSSSKHASDLAELADYLISQNPSYRLCYENWCWATVAPSWKAVWDVVKRADRPNIGLCLDTFQTAGGEWADPCNSSGLIETSADGSAISINALKEKYERSLLELAKEVPGDKIYVLQISDAYKAPQPLEKDVDESGMRPRGRWSGGQRPMPYEGGYLPCEGFTRAVLETGFRGVMSMEVFDGGPDGRGKDKDSEEFTRKSMESLKRLLQSAAATKDV